MAEEENQQPPYDTGSEPVFDFYCELCREDGNMLEAEGYCADCREYLCGTCYTHHRRTRGTRHHVLMDGDHMPQNTSLCYDRVSKDISKKCGQHPRKPVEYYCKSHDFLGCNICIIEGHRHCSNIENITQAAETIMQSQEFKSFIQMIDQFEQNSRSIMKKVRDNIYSSKSWCSEVANSVRKFREETNLLLDELEKSILTQAVDLQKEEENKLMNVSDHVTTSLQSVEKIIEEFDDLRKAKKVCEIFIKLKERKCETIAIQAQLDQAEKENVIREHVFDPNTKLKEYLNSQNGLGKLSAQNSATAVAMKPPYHSPVNTNTVAMTLSQYNPVSTNTVAMALPQYNPVNTNTVAMALPHYNPVNTKATHATDINVTSSNDQYFCSITGSAVVSNNRLVIVDHDNNKVKLTDTQSNKVISELTELNWSWDVTVIGRNQIAVTAHDSILLLLIVSDTLTLDREITVSGRCSGVAYSRNRLVVTYTCPVKLEIMDLSGEVMMASIRNVPGGNTMFVNPEYVCISKDEEIIYVSDSDINRVTSLTFDGVVKSVYRDSELIGPENVCVDHHGYVYVCGYTSRNVHMLTADLTKIQIILTQADGLDRAVYSVSHCQETNSLYVGMRNNDNVKVYQLSQ